MKRKQFIATQTYVFDEIKKDFLSPVAYGYSQIDK